jgi:fructose-1,6-bisphosphatase/inositol monophosphatase family enzyme
MNGADAYAFDAAVTALLAKVGAEVVMPSFRALSADQVREKAPGDVVTDADVESERRLALGLHEILAIRVIGEEAVAADPTLLDALDQGLAWIVDPIDGTANFATGHLPFAIMVALIGDGRTLAGWIHDPVTGTTCHAALGQGAWRDGAPLAARATGATPPRAALALRYLPDDLGRQLAGRIADRLDDGAIPRSAGHQYLRLVTGETDVALFWRMLPWDHAAGALILAEAGGRIAHFDGSAYAPADGIKGALAAASPALWTQARAILFGEVL